MAASLVITLGGGAVWFGMSPAPHSEGRAPDANGSRSVVPQGRELVAVPSPPPAAVVSALTAAPRVTRPSTLPGGRVGRARGRAPSPAPVARPPEPGLLSLNATPWGSVFIDGHPEGDTPLIDLRLIAGSHVVRVERDGFRSYERRIDVAPGQHLRVTDIVLEER